jgi:hypothetical protein
MADFPEAMLIQMKNFRIINARLLLGLGLLLSMVGSTSAAKTYPLLSTVEVSVRGLDVQVKYEFSEAAFSQRVVDAADQQREQTEISFCARVDNLCKSLSLSEGVVSASFVFSTVIATVRTTQQEVDSVYPILSKIDDRLKLLYAPAILPETYRGLIKVRHPSGLKAQSLTYQEAQGYILIGEHRDLRERLTLRFANSAPIFVKKSVRGSVQQLHDFYEARLGPHGHPQVTLVVTYRDVSEPVIPTNRADVTKNGVIFLRLQKLNSTDFSSFEGSLTSLIAHELLHLWQQFDTSEREQSYLHEGQAEYGSWLAIDSLWPQHDLITKQVNAALDHCIRYLGANSLVAMYQHHAIDTRYSCGPIAQWLLDQEIRAGRFEASADTRSIFELWRRELPLQNNRGLLREAGLTKTAQPNPLRTFLYEGGNARWYSIASYLNDHGVRVTIDPPTDFMRRVSILKPLVDSSCGFTAGIGEENGEVFVESIASCLALGGRNVILSLDGLSPMRDLDKLEAHVADVCAREGNLIASSVKAGVSVEAKIPCLTELKPAPPVLKVSNAFP